MVAAVSEDARATTVLLVGALMIRLAVGGAYAKYVRTGMGPPLLTAGVLLAGLGVFGVVRALRRVPEPPDAHGHRHSQRIGWLLLAPVLALLLVTPPTLGSFGVDRSSAVNVSTGGKVFAALPPGRPVPMT